MKPLLVKRTKPIKSDLTEYQFALLAQDLYVVYDIANPILYRKQLWGKSAVAKEHATSANENVFREDSGFSV